RTEQRQSRTEQRQSRGLNTELHRTKTEPHRAKTDVDPYGFERSNDFDYESYEELMSKYLTVLTKRSIKWSKLLQGKSRLEKNFKGECG
ncbi:growth hormone-regulated TBC protein 1-A, partial [Tachysurus ichikawai]